MKKIETFIEGKFQEKKLKRLLKKKKQSKDKDYLDDLPS